MSHETATITIKRYRSPDGKPTCCRDVATGELCAYIGARKFGTVDVCLLGQQRDLLDRADGWTRPDKACEVWKDES